MVAIAYYSIPSPPFQLESKYFGIVILLIMTIVQLLFLAVSSLPDMFWWRWKKVCAWFKKLNLPFTIPSGFSRGKSMKHDNNAEATGIESGGRDIESQPV